MSKKTPAPLTDAEVLDALTEYLRDNEQWNGGDFCELAASLIPRTGRSLEGGHDE